MQLDETKTWHHRFRMCNESYLAGDLVELRFESIGLLIAGHGIFSQRNVEENLWIVWTRLEKLLQYFQRR